jgi:MYXO-CTERM domain-containing protein
VRQPQGCGGCETDGTDAGAGASGAAVLLAALTLVRRRRAGSAQS